VPAAGIDARVVLAGDAAPECLELGCCGVGEWGDGWVSKPYRLEGFKRPWDP
jgi:hypothetical protein